MRRKVLLVQPSMQPPGGGNGVAAWAVQALAREHDVTVLSWWPVHVDSIDRFFGTSLGEERFERLVVPRAWRIPLDHLPVPAALLRSSLLMRYTRHIVEGFDVVLGVHNETDYGRRGIQYVHYPTYLRPRPAVDLRWYHQFTPAVNAYYAFSDWIADFSLERMKSNLTLCNSNWTGERIHAFLGIRAQTLYPPVLGEPSPIAWADRRRAFVAMGRLSPEKEYDRIIRILAQLRRSFPEITLTIVGTWDSKTRWYYERLRTIAASFDGGTWVTFRHDLSRAEVRALLHATRYGIHGMREEHFGMAPAEMARAGMVVWVPDGGGQVEIVGDAPSLRYASEDEAVQKIADVISRPQEEDRLRAHLAEHTMQFSHEHFVERMREVVKNFRE